MKKITITEIEPGNVNVEIDKGINFASLIVIAETLIETVIENSSSDINIYTIIEDILRLYFRDNEESE